jgi:hypothetical protein
MLLSARQILLPTDRDWLTFIDWIKIRGLTQVRSIDNSLNDYVSESGELTLKPQDLRNLNRALRELPRIKRDREYYLLAVNATKGEDVGFLRELDNTIGRDALRYLECDLSNRTLTSSLLNCGPWEGDLAAYHERVNEVGLLSFEDAAAAREKLPAAFGQSDPLAHADVWMLYEVPPSLRK